MQGPSLRIMKIESITPTPGFDPECTKYIPAMNAREGVWQLF